MDTTYISLKKLQHEIREKTPVHPQLWVVAGEAPKTGCTTVSRVFTDLLRRNGQRAEFLAADKLFGAQTNEMQDAAPDGGDYHVLPVAFLKEINKILQHTTLYRYNFEDDNDFLIIDMSARISAHTVDLFLVADLPILLLRADAQGIDNAKRFFKICLLKILDTFFDSNHPQIRAVIADLEEHPPFSPVIARRIKALRRLFPGQARFFETFMQNFSPRLLLNHSTPEHVHEFSDFYFREAATAFPPATTVIGTLQEYPLAPHSTVHLRAHDGSVNDEQLGKLENIIRRKMSSLIHT